MPRASKDSTSGNASGGGSKRSPKRNAKPSQAKSSQAKSSQVKPSPAKPSQAALPSELPMADRYYELAEELTPQSAEQVLAGLRELVPEPELLPAPGRSLEGKALMLCGRVAEAIVSFEAAYAAAGQAPEHGINLAAALLAAGQASQAAALLQPLHQQGLAVLEPDQRAALLRNFATAASQLEQPLLALQLRRQWLQLEPEAVPSDRWLGWCRVGLAQPPGDHARQEALAFLQDLRRLHPADRTIAEALAEALEAEGDYRQAASAVEQASWGRAEALLRRLLELQPDHASGHHLLGKSLRAVGEPHQALAAQQRSCALDPWLGWNWFAAGELLMEQQRWPEAAEAFAWALQALPAEGWIAHQLQQARSAGVVEGDSYQHWIRHHEPRLPDPLTPLTQQFWTLEGQGQWRALHGPASLQPRRAPLGSSPWPVEGWLVLLGPQTQLRPGALQALEGWLAQALPWQQAGQAVADLSPRQRACWALPDLVYADEDRIEPDGRRWDPWFKPGWVPESFWSSPWLGSLSVWRLSWLRHQTLPLPPMDPAARFRWQLSALERNPRIEPCPLLLSHQAMASGGPHGRADPASDPAAEAAALFAHLQAQGEAVQAVTPLPQRPGCFQLHWALPKRVGCSLLIPTRDRADLLQVCLQSVWDSTEAARAQGIDLTLVLIDNGSVEQTTTDLLCRWQQRLGDAMTTVRLEQPFNWSQLNNQVAARARGEVLLCLNNDIEARQPGWLEAMVAQALRPVVGCVGANLLYPDGTLQHGGVVLGVQGGADHAYRHLPLNHGVHRGRSGLLTGWGAVTGACLMLRRQLLLQLGGFDEGLPVEFNDVDLCLRLGSLGYRHVIPPEAVLIHHESQSRDAQASRTADQALQRLQRRWPGRLRSGSPWWPQQMEPNHVDGRPLGMAVSVD